MVRYKRALDLVRFVGDNALGCTQIAHYGCTSVVAVRSWAGASAGCISSMFNYSGCCWSLLRTWECVYDLLSMSCGRKLFPFLLTDA